jgi:ABC-type cobalamin transport system ATPase subunit
MDLLTEQELAIPGSKAKGVIAEALILRVASLAVLLVVWQFLSLMLSARYVPGPLLTFSAVAENIASGAILRHFTVTMLRMLVSFALAMALGVVTGTLMGLYRRCVDPELLLMDEPFSGLDELTARSMRELLLGLWQETRKTVLFVTHNCFEACFVADRIVVLSPRPGRIAQVISVELPRPRDYENPRLFEQSVTITRLVTGRPTSGS